MFGSCSTRCNSSSCSSIRCNDRVGARHLTGTGCPGRCMCAGGVQGCSAMMKAEPYLPFSQGRQAEEVLAATSVWYVPASHSSHATLPAQPPSTQTRTHSPPATYHPPLSLAPRCIWRVFTAVIMWRCQLNTQQAATPCATSAAAAAAAAAATPPAARLLARGGACALTCPCPR